MKFRIAAFLLGASAFLLPALGQNPQSFPLPMPSGVEKELSARASDVTEVTLGKNMLAFAAKFLDEKDGDDVGVRQLIEGLDGIYVREYQFDKENQYSPEEIAQLRKNFETPEWVPVVHTHDRRSGETTDILIKMTNGENKGMFILAAEPKELTIVLILGPVRIEDLGKLHGIAGLGSLPDVAQDANEKGKEKAKEKGKGKPGTDGEQ
jgi:Domain of unknown function (DUF4252)